MTPFYSIVIIGAGGTGGNLIVWLAQFLAGRNKDTYSFTICDGDVVEKKNLSRQPFTDDDIGDNKAAALAGTLSEGYGLNIRYRDSYIDTIDDIEAMFVKPRRGETLKILVGCVDNHHARKLMHEFFEREPDVVYIDAANEFSYGEVVSGIKARGKVLSPDRASYFPEVLEGSTARSEESCTALNEVAPQHMVTNKMSALICLSMISNLMQNEVVPEGITHFDAFKLFMRTDAAVRGGAESDNH